MSNHCCCQLRRLLILTTCVTGHNVSWGQRETPNHPTKAMWNKSIVTFYCWLQDWYSFTVFTWCLHRFRSWNTKWSNGLILHYVPFYIEYTYTHIWHIISKVPYNQLWLNPTIQSLSTILPPLPSNDCPVLVPHVHPPSSLRRPARMMAWDLSESTWSC